MGTHQAVYEFAVLEEEHGGNVAHAIFDGDIVVVFHIAFAHHDTAFILTGQFLDDGSYLAAGSAPCGPEIHHQGKAVVFQLLKVLVCDCYFHDFLFCYWVIE